MKNILTIISIFLFVGCQSQKPITNFSECEKAGGIIMESYPRQCRVESQDQTFTEEIETPWDKNEFEIVAPENKTCQTKEDCETPPEYLIRSNCPYSSRCIDKECYTVCPEPFHDTRPETKEETDALKHAIP